MIVREGLQLFRKQLSLNGQSALISRKLRDIPDCVLDFRWEFRTWGMRLLETFWLVNLSFFSKLLTLTVPFVARHLPSDNCRLFKKDNLLRYALLS